VKLKVWFRVFDEGLGPCWGGAFYSTTGWKLAVDCTSGLPDDKELLFVRTRI